MLAIAFPARALPLDATAANAAMSLDALLIALPAGLAMVLGLALLHYRRRALESTRGMNQLEERLRTEAAARQRAEQAQRRTEERYRTPADQVKDYAIYIMDDQGRHRSWNEGVQRLLGYGKTEFLAASSADLFAPEDRAAGLPEQELAEAIAHGRSTGDQQLVRKDGSRFWASVSTTSVHSRQGELLGFAKRLRDLSEMRRVEEELHRSKEALELANEAAGLGTWDHNLVTGELHWDTRAKALFGLPPRDARHLSHVGRSDPPGRPPSAEEVLDRALRDRQAFSTHYRAIWPDGSHPLARRDRPRLATVPVPAGRSG